MFSSHVITSNSENFQSSKRMFGIDFVGKQFSSHITPPSTPLNHLSSLPGKCIIDGGGVNIIEFLPDWNGLPDSQFCVMKFLLSKYLTHGPLFFFPQFLQTIVLLSF